MLRILTPTNCAWAPANKALANAALESGEQYSLDVVLFNTDETDKAAKLGLGLPVLVRDDGAMSKDAKNWVGGKIVSKTIAGIESGNDAEHRDESDESRGLDDGGAKEARTLRKSRAVS